MSSRSLVLDASIVIKALVHEHHSTECQALLASGLGFMAPDLMPIECANVLWKKVQRGSLTPEMAKQAQHGLLTLAPVRILPSRPYQPRALALALEHGRSVHDALYLAVAEAEGSVFITADERLVNALHGTPMASRVRWIGAGFNPAEPIPCR
jgi:predicted nucleic acid-binding protein